MRIDRINSTNFEKNWIKIAKPKNPKLIENSALIAGGLSSIFLGLDAFSIIPSTVVETSIDGSAYLCGENFSNNETLLTYCGSAPWGTMNSGLGSYGMAKTLIDQKKNEKKIPS